MTQTQEFLTKVFFEHQIQIKMLHFQTKDYGAHKELDTYLQKFLTNFDKYMEVSQGISGRLKLTKLDIQISTTPKLNDFIRIINKSKNQVSSDLSAILDDMTADVNQLKYLLTFK